MSPTQKISVADVANFESRRVLCNIYKDVKPHA